MRVRRALCLSCLIGIGLLSARAPESRADAVLGAVLPLRQPDGTVLQTRIWGDEFYSVVETLDGYTLTREPATNRICYARLSKDGRSLESIGVCPGEADPLKLGLTPHVRSSAEAAAAEARANRAQFALQRFSGPWAQARGPELRGPTTGAVLGLTLIIDFSDDVGTIPPTDVTAYCNQVGYTGYGNNGSVRDYYYAVSEGKLTYTNYVPAAYYRALYPKTYYNDPNIAYGQRARELIGEALTALEAGGLDFSQFDANGDGIIDALNCFYAGYSNSAWAKGLWPHASGISFCADGVCTQSYQITDMQSSLRLSTFCHENGHMLMGWPDLYDYDYDSRGVGQFCLMCYSTSSTNPEEPCAYMKYIAGWATVTTLTAPRTVALRAANNSLALYANPANAHEYYLIENRQQSVRDSGLPDAGLAIWHVDTAGNNDNQQQTPESHYLVTLVQADGRWDLEHNTNYGDSTDLFAAPSYTQCTPSTTPNTNWWDGTPSGLAVTSVSTNSALMTFVFTPLRDCNGNGVYDYLDIAAGTSTDCNSNGWPDECELANGWEQDYNTNGIPDSCEPDCNANGMPDSVELAALLGLTGAYYDNADFTGPRRARLDSMVNFDWGTSAPLTGIDADTFSVRWTGYVHTPAATGTYQFFTRTDDGARLWVAGQLLIDHWVDQSTTEWSGAILLQGNRDYSIRLEYYDNGGSALAQLRWQPPGAGKVTIPATSLRPARDCDGNGLIDICDIAAGTAPDSDGDGVLDLCDPCAGDANCDLAVNWRDIDYLIAGMNDNPSAWSTLFPSPGPACAFSNLDSNGDGHVNWRDIDPFITHMNTACPR
jgi:M6 family metalloprotease-like protein